MYKGALIYFDTDQKLLDSVHEILKDEFNVWVFNLNDFNFEDIKSMIRDNPKEIVLMFSSLCERKDYEHFEGLIDFIKEQAEIKGVVTFLIYEKMLKGLMTTSKRFVKIDKNIFNKNYEHFDHNIKLFKEHLSMVCFGKLIKKVRKSIILRNEIRN